MDVKLFIFQSVVYGMVFAFGYHLLLKKGIIADNHTKSLFSTGVSLSLTILSFIGLGVGHFIYEKKIQIRPFFLASQLSENGIEILFEYSDIA